MTSANQGVANGNSYGCSTTNGAAINPEDTRDCMFPGIFKFCSSPIQLRQ